MNRKDLLRKFLKDNFDLSCFNIKWESDFLVTLEDTNDTISFYCFDGVTIDLAINGIYFNSYTLDKDLINNNIWFVINKKRGER